MKKILIIGGWSNGSAFTIPCLENKNRVTITEPYRKIYKRSFIKDKFHSALKINLPKKLKFKNFRIQSLREKILI